MNYRKSGCFLCMEEGRAGARAGLLQSPMESDGPRSILKFSLCRIGGGGGGGGKSDNNEWGGGRKCTSHSRPMRLSALTLYLSCETRSGEFTFPCHLHQVPEIRSMICPKKHYLVSKNLVYSHFYLVTINNSVLGNSGFIAGMN